MKIKVVAVSNLPAYTVKLRESLNKFHVDYEIIDCVWNGFYTKINEAYKWCKKNQDYDYMLFVDAHDVIFLGDLREVIRRIKKFPDHDAIFSVEKACWPDTNLALEYPPVNSDWKYLNSGSYLFKPKKLIELVDKFPPFIGIDDQLYFTKIFLGGEFNILLDYRCILFQSIAFEAEGDFNLNAGLCNTKTGEYPLIIHGNGKTDMTKYYEL